MHLHPAMDEYRITDSHPGMAESLHDIRPVTISTFSALEHAVDEKYITTRSEETVRYEEVKVPLIRYIHKQRVNKDDERTLCVNGGQGIRVDSGAQGHHDELHCACILQKGEHIFEWMGDKASLQLHWPNLDRPWSTQIRIKDETLGKKLLGCPKLIRKICEAIIKIYEENEGNMRPPVEWRLGPEGIQLRNLYLDAVKAIPPSKSFEVELSVRRIQVKVDA